MFFNLSVNKLYQTPDTMIPTGPDTVYNTFTLSNLAWRASKLGSSMSMFCKTISGLIKL